MTGKNTVPIGELVIDGIADRKDPSLFLAENSTMVIELDFNESVMCFWKEGGSVWLWLPWWCK